METFKAHYKANRLQRDIPDIKAGLTHRPPVSHTHSPLLSLSLSLSLSHSLVLSQIQISRACVKLVCHPQKFCCVMAVALEGRGWGTVWKYQKMLKWICNGQAYSVSSSFVRRVGHHFHLGCGCRSRWGRIVSAEEMKWSSDLMADYQAHV